MSDVRRLLSVGGGEHRERKAAPTPALQPSWKVPVPVIHNLLHAFQTGNLSEMENNACQRITLHMAVAQHHVSYILFDFNIYCLKEYLFMQ